MEPRSELEQEKAALLAEQALLKRRVAELTAHRAKLERRLAENPHEQTATAVGPHKATDLEVTPDAKGQSDSGGGD